MYPSNFLENATLRIQLSRGFNRKRCVTLRLCHNNLREIYSLISLIVKKEACELASSTGLEFGFLWSLVVFFSYFPLMIQCKD